MAKSIGKLAVFLGVDSSGVDKGLNKATTRLSAFRSVAGGMMTQIAGALSFGAVIKGASAYIDKLDQIGKSAKNLGVTAEYFQKMKFAAEKTGTPLAAVTGAMDQLKRVTGDFLRGNAKATKIFEELGLSREELQGLAPDELFRKVTSALAAVEDQAVKTSLGAKLLGGQFAQLNNYLSEYDQLGAEIESRGGLISREQIKAAEELKNAFTDMQTSLGGVVASLFDSLGITKQLKESAAEMSALSGGADAADKAAGIHRGTTILGVQTFRAKDLARISALAEGKNRIEKSARLQAALQKYAEQQQGYQEALDEELKKSGGHMLTAQTLARSRYINKFILDHMYSDNGSFYSSKSTMEESQDRNDAQEEEKRKRAEVAATAKRKAAEARRRKAEEKRLKELAKQREAEAKAAAKRTQEFRDYVAEDAEKFKTALSRGTRARDQYDRLEEEAVDAFKKYAKARGIDQNSAEYRVGLRQVFQNARTLADAKAERDYQLEELQKRSAAITAAANAPQHASTVLAGSIEAYRAQFNNEKNYMKSMADTALKQLETQRKLLEDTEYIVKQPGPKVGANIQGGR